MWVCRSKPGNISFATAIACHSLPIYMYDSVSFLLTGRILSFLKIKPAFIAASKTFNPEKTSNVHSPIKVS